MSDRSLRTARIISSIAATCIALACGTNYVYSAWGPQFAEKLKLSATQSNLIGLAGNLGMYAIGIPIGIFVDTKGPRPAVLFGSLFLALGYFPLWRAYVAGEGSMFLLCLYNLFTGLGGCAAFQAAVKTSALNWPHHRGTATAFPMAGFGLSAFFFSMFAGLFFHHDNGTGDFLFLLAAGTSGMTFLSFFFLRVLPHPAYSTLPSRAGLTRTDSNPLRRRSDDSKVVGGRGGVEPELGADASQALAAESDETSSLVSKTSSSNPGDVVEEVSSVDKDHSHHIDIRGLEMLPTPEFWFLFSLMGILAGIGLMTINNIGNDTTALWRHYDDSASSSFIGKRQAMHVSILSACQFVGRLSSGVGSDFLVKKLHASRSWCLVIACLVFLAAQMFAISIQNPNRLFLVSSLSGLAYGYVFGVYPSLVAEAFGVHGLSQNWGCMTLAPVVSGNVFNLFYGMVFDAHSTVTEDGQRQCEEGLACYRNAYIVTLAACILGLSVTLWSIHYTHMKRRRELKERELEGRQA